MKPTLLILAMVGLTACSMTPQLPEIQPDIPQTWQEESANKDQQAATDLPTWRQFFPQPQVQGLIEQALANNRDLRMALARVKKAAAVAGAAESNRWPTLQGVVGHQSSRTPADLSQSGTTSFLHRNDVGVALPSYEVDLWQRVGDLSDAAAQRHLASEETARATRVLLVAQVVEALCHWREAWEQVGVAERLLANRQEVLTLTRKRQEAGLAPKGAIWEAQAQWESSRSELAEWQRQLNNRYHALALLLASDKPLSPDWPPLAGLEVEGTLQPGLPSQILLVRPDIRAAELQLVAANGDVGAARAAFFPRITLMASGGVASADLGSLFQGGSGTWNFMPTLTIPIFELPRRQRDLEAAEAEREVLLHGYEKAIQQGFREVAETLALQEVVQTRQQALQEAVVQRQNRLTQGEARFRSGLDGRLELLELEKQLWQSRSVALGGLRQKLVAKVVLFKVLGGGKED